MVGSRSFVGHVRGQSSGHVLRHSLVPFQCRARRRHTPIRRSVGEGHAKLEAALAALHGVDGTEVESLRAALKRAKEVKVQTVDVQIKECEGFLSRARAHMASAPQ